MSSTKIVIIVLVVIGLLFVIFVAIGAFRNDEKAERNPPDWTKSIKGLFSSLQPKLQLKEKFYPSSSGKPETIPPDEGEGFRKHPFRTATFHLKSGTAEITYTDVTPIESDGPLKDMDNPQKCKLPQDPDPDVSDTRRCSILAFKRGGTFTFRCTNNTACRVEVE
jgi:hypothetical protein